MPFIVIPMDSMLIQQVLITLMENAAPHAEGMTKLTLKVFTVGNRAVFEVTDNGCGIPRERLKTLFSGTGGTDPDVPADSRKHGMGIGLVGVRGHHQGARRRDRRREPRRRGHHHPFLAGDGKSRSGGHRG